MWATLLSAGLALSGQAILPSSNGPEQGEPDWRAFCRASGREIAGVDKPGSGLPPLRAPTADELIHCTSNELLAETERLLDEAERSHPPRIASVDELVREKLTGRNGLVAAPPLDLTSVPLEETIVATDASASYPHPDLGVRTSTILGNLPIGFSVVIVGLLGLIYIVFRSLAKQFKMGWHLTKMTNVFEDIERTRQTMFIGAGGGIDNLPPTRQA